MIRRGRAARAGSLIPRPPGSSVATRPPRRGGPSARSPRGRPASSTRSACRGRKRAGTVWESSSSVVSPRDSRRGRQRASASKRWRPRGRRAARRGRRARPARRASPAARGRRRRGCAAAAGTGARAALVEHRELVRVIRSPPRRAAPRPATSCRSGWSRGSRWPCPSRPPPRRARRSAPATPAHELLEVLLEELRAPRRGAVERKARMAPEYTTWQPADVAAPLAVAHDSEARCSTAACPPRLPSRGQARHDVVQDRRVGDPHADAHAVRLRRPSRRRSPPFEAGEAVVHQRSGEARRRAGDRSMPGQRLTARGGQRRAAAEYTPGPPCAASAGSCTFDGSAPDRARTCSAWPTRCAPRPRRRGLLRRRAGTPGIGLAHRRLSIIDLSHEADHPVRGEDGPVQAMLNGEIYNFRELRARARGRATPSAPRATRRRSSTATRRGRRHRRARSTGCSPSRSGTGAQRRLRARPRRLRQEAALLLARRAAARVRVRDQGAARRRRARRDRRERGSASTSRFGYVPTPRTLFAGIRKVPPASILVVDAGGVHAPRRYWDLAFPPEGSARRSTLDEAAERVRELFTTAVRKRLMADVPLGVLLSGGVDSSAVAALIARHAPGPPEAPSPWASRATRSSTSGRGRRRWPATSAPSTTSRWCAPHAAALMETLLHHHDEPFGDSSALPTYLVAQRGAPARDRGPERRRGRRDLRRLRPLPRRADRGGAARARAPGRGRARAAPARRGRHPRARCAAPGASRARPRCPLDERIFSWTRSSTSRRCARSTAAASWTASALLSSYREALAPRAAPRRSSAASCT